MYNDPTDPNDDAAQHELSVYAGTMCAAPKGGATAAGTPVQLQYCDGSAAQKWNMPKPALGIIVNDQSGLCLPEQAELYRAGRKFSWKPATAVMLRSGAGRPGSSRGRGHDGLTRVLLGHRAAPSSCG